MNKRYELRKTNRVLHVFDTFTYSEVDMFEAYEEDKAIQRVNFLNSRKKK